MTADEAHALARVLRELCILREGQVLHVGGYTIGPLKKLPRKQVVAKGGRGKKRPKQPDARRAGNKTPPSRVIP